LAGAFSKAGWLTAGFITHIYVAHLQVALDKMRMRSVVPVSGGKGRVQLTEEQQRHLRSLGYLQ